MRNWQEIILGYLIFGAFFGLIIVYLRFLFGPKGIFRSGKKDEKKDTSKQSKT